MNSPSRAIDHPQVRDTLSESLNQAIRLVSEAKPIPEGAIISAIFDQDLLAHAIRETSPTLSSPFDRPNVWQDFRLKVNNATILSLRTAVAFGFKTSEDTFKRALLDDDAIYRLLLGPEVSRAVQLAAIRKNARLILAIDHPHEDIQIEAVRKQPELKFRRALCKAANLVADHELVVRKSGGC